MPLIRVSGNMMSRQNAKMEQRYCASAFIKLRMLTQIAESEGLLSEEAKSASSSGA